MIKRKTVDKKNVGARYGLTVLVLGWIFICGTPGAVADTVLLSQGFERQPGAPVAQAVEINATDTAAPFTLNVFNGDREGDNLNGSRVSAAVIRLNGKQIFGPSDFSRDVSLLTADVNLEVNNELSVELRGRPGSVLTVEIVGEGDTPPVVTIESPASLTTLGHTPVTLTGSVSSNTASLTVNGAPVTLNNGGFSTEVALQEGHNIIVARAVTAAGLTANDSISLSLDLTPPRITVESHTDGQVVYNDKVTITGLVNDIVRGTVAPDQANVMVNDIEGIISNRSYSVVDVPLAIGANRITIVASDQVGNLDSRELTLNYEVPQGQRLELVSGQSQTATINTLVNSPLVIRVVDDDLQPVTDASVVFRVVQGSGVVGVGGDAVGRAVVVATDAEGLASTRFQVGARVGTANHKVRARVVGYDSEVVFNVSATGEIGNKLSVNSGNNQRGMVNQALPLPLVTVVTDAGGNVVPGGRVRYDVTVGEGHFGNDQTTVELQTDSDGRAAIKFVLGGLEGLDAQRVTAHLLDGPEGQSITAGFTATGFVPGDPGQTTISGLVLDNQDSPIPGVTVRVDGTTRQAVTDAQGQFRITETPNGPLHLVADGSTTTVPGEFPALSYNLVTIAGVDNPLPSPIYMVKLNPDHVVSVGPQDAELSLDEYPGFKLEIAGNSVTFPDGSREGRVSVTPVNASKVPMPPPNGMQPQFIVTIQPTGTLFDPPARLSLPNFDGHAAGAQVEMYSYDHDLEEFVAIGLGTVNEDGSVIRSNPGVGVVKAGWHCGSQPGGSGCTHGCPICQDCDGDCNCFAQGDDPRLASLEIEGDCQMPGCQNGSPVQNPDDLDVPDTDTVGDCKMPGCLNGAPQDINDDSDITPEDAECKVCNSGSLDDKPEGTITPSDPCLYCAAGVGEPVMGEVSGPTFVCPGQSYDYEVNVDLPGGTTVWGGDADPFGTLIVPGTAVDGDSFNVQAQVGSCSKSLSVSASDGQPGDTSEAANCALNPLDCLAVNSLADEAKAWSVGNEAALGGGLSGGCADAARHAYFNAIGTIDIGAENIRYFLDAHEFSNFNGCEDNNMDLINNAEGRAIGIASGCTTRACAQDAVADALRNGELTVWSGNQTGSGALSSSSVCNVTY